MLFEGVGAVNPTRAKQNVLYTMVKNGAGWVRTPHMTLDQAMGELTFLIKKAVVTSDNKSKQEGVNKAREGYAKDGL